MDPYRHLGKKFLPLGESEIYALAEQFAHIARRYDLTLETCAEAIDLSRFGIAHGQDIFTNEEQLKKVPIKEMLQVVIINLVSIGMVPETTFIYLKRQ